MWNNFECHVTVKKPADPAEYNKIAEEMGWHTSAIDGDPELGDHVYFYFTRRSDDTDVLYEAMDALRERLGKKTVIREKIEEIIYDVSYK